MQRTLIESDVYQQQIAALGGAERLDDLLRGVVWALSTNPEVYDVLKGTRDMRMIKTDAFPGAPALRIWFRIDEDGYHVHLEEVEAIEQEA